MSRRLVAAVDGSESSLKGLDVAISLAAKIRAPLDIVSVEEELPHYRTRRAEARAEQTDAERYFGALHADARLQATQQGVSVTTRILRGHRCRPSWITLATAKPICSSSPRPVTPASGTSF